MSNFFKSMFEHFVCMCVFPLYFWCPEGPEEMVGSAEPLLHLIDLLMASFSKFSHVSCLRIQSIADSCGHSLGCKSAQK